MSPRYRPLWLGLGAVAFDLLSALVVTSLLRARIGYRAWRAVHWLAYASWPFALVHGLGTGSDSRFGWLVLITIVCAGAVGAALAARLLRSPGPLPLRGRSRSGGSRLRAAGHGLVPRRAGEAWLGRTGRHPAYILKPPLLCRGRAARRQSLRPGCRCRSTAGSAVRFARSNDTAGDVGVAFGAAVRGRVPAILRLTLWGTAADEGISDE